MGTVGSSGRSNPCRHVLGAERVGSGRLGKLCHVEGKAGGCRGALRHPQERDVGQPRFAEAASHIAVGACEPDLLDMLVLGEALDPSARP